MDPKLTLLLDQHLGALRRIEWQRAGIRDEDIKRYLASGRLVQRDRGVVQVPHGTVAWAQLRVRGIIPTCVSVAKIFDMWELLSHEELHVAYRRGTASLPDSIKGINGRARPLVLHKVHYENRHLDVVMHALYCLPPVEAIVMAESAIVKGQVSLAEVRAQVEKRRFMPQRELVALIAPASESVLETVGRYVLASAGYHVQIQRYFPGLGRLDALVEGILGIEFDGRATHDTRAGYSEDRRRNNVMVLKAVPTLRVTYGLVVHRPLEFLRLVAQALQSVRGAQHRSLGGS